MTRKSDARARVLEVLRRSPGPRRPGEVAGILGRSGGSTRELLGQMARDGMVERIVPGWYALPRSDGADTADARPSAPDAPPDTPDEVSGAVATGSESALTMRDRRGSLAGTFVYSQADGGMIPLSELKRRKGYA